ncbi:MAG TPA: hypothetical protein VHM30_12470 [Gemmatimonadaceae bacterium]|nr:hypothetical protein [Gemmatimonadaceae bacterium]
MAGGTLFVLSPARVDGERAKLLLDPRASFPLATALREPAGLPIGEVFSFLSSLYFRGKLTYARRFARPLRKAPSILVITTDRGLVLPETRITRDDLVAFSRVDIASGDERYVGPLRRDVEQLAAAAARATRVVLLGSIATGKYVDVFMKAFDKRLLFPAAFVGRGDMSRGGLLLRHAREGMELDYTPVAGAVRRGARPPKLERLPRRVADTDREELR